MTCFVRVYVGTNGRGIFYGDAAGTTPPPTSTSVTTSPSTHSTSSGVVTVPGTSLPASSTSVAIPTATASPWGQCGGMCTNSRVMKNAHFGTFLLGNNWTGPTTCPAGFVCRVGNECKPFPWLSIAQDKTHIFVTGYSQCVAAS